MADTSQVETAARAVLAALDFRSSSESRLAATAYLESLKGGDVQFLGSTASALVKQKSLSSEVRHYGLKLLQHLVRMRWDELTTQNKAQLAELVVGLIAEIATPQEEWVLKSQTAALVAEVVRHEGTSLLQGLLLKLSDLAFVSPSHAELVIMVLRWLPEDITVYNEDLEGERRRQLLLGLTQALPQILPILYKLLELHFGNTVSLLQQNQVEVARQHATVVTTTLNALLAYVEWAPVNQMADHQFIEACGILLNALDFRLRAGEFLKQIASRKRPTDNSSSAYDGALRRVFEALSHATKVIQNGASTGSNEDDSEFAECLSEAMVALGSHNLQCIAALQDHLTLYLQQMLGFLQHDKVAVHYPAFLFWLAVLKDTPSNDGTIIANGSMGVLGPNDKDKKCVSILFSDEVYGSLLDLAFHWVLKKNQKAQLSENPLKSDDAISSSGDYRNYRGRLLDLVRMVALQRPVLAVGKISEKIKESCANTICTENNLAVLESSQRLLEAIIHTIFDQDNHPSSTVLPTLQPHLEGMLKVLLWVKWNDPAFVEIHGRLLDATGPFLRSSSTATITVVNKIFDLLTSLPVAQKSIAKDPVAFEISRARLQVCTSFLRIAKAADKTISTHMEVIWKTVSGLQEQGLLQQGEYNSIAEAFLVAGSAAGRECEAQTLNWFLKPLQEKWVQNNWQDRYLLHPMDLVELLMRETVEESQNEEMWSMFHSVTFFERVLKRCADRHSDSIHKETAPAEGSSPFSHPMVSHLMWIVPSLLKLVHCIHAFWSPSLKSLLPGTVQGALLMSSAEQAFLVGEAGLNPSRGNALSLHDVETNASGNSGTAGKENEIRNWVKGVRDSGYSTLGLAAAHFSDIFFEYMDSGAVELAFVENLDAMEFRHVRNLLHFTIVPLVKSCPAHKRDSWLGKMLPVLLGYCEQALSTSWENLIRDGAVKVSEGACKSEVLGLKAEVIQEKMLRDLSRETCSLLAILASPALNPLLPSGEQLLQSQCIEASGRNSSSLFGFDCMMRFIMQHRSIAEASLSICRKALKWPDSDAVHKAIAFCGSIVSVAMISCDLQLQNFVARDLFTDVIEALTVESNALAQAELISLFRIIYLLMAHQNVFPRQVLQSSPCITEEVLSAFENALAATSSAKEQRQYIKSLLLQAGGSNLKALMGLKNASLITNVKNRTRGPPQLAPDEHDEAGHIGLAAMT